MFVLNAKNHARRRWISAVRSDEEVLALASRPRVVSFAKFLGGPTSCLASGDKRPLSAVASCVMDASLLNCRGFAAWLAGAGLEARGGKAGGWSGRSGAWRGARSIYLEKKGSCLTAWGLAASGLECEVDALAGADALEVGLLVIGNVVIADGQLCQCPLGGVIIGISMNNSS